LAPAGIRFLPAVTALAVGKLLMPLKRKVVSLNFASWNRLVRWFREIDALRRPA
jgi:hypothetical protein